jgi:hypothetical protein
VGRGCCKSPSEHWAANFHSFPAPVRRPLLPGQSISCLFGRPRLRHPATTAGRLSPTSFWIRQSGRGYVGSIATDQAPEGSKAFFFPTSDGGDFVSKKRPSIFFLIPVWAYCRCSRTKQAAEGRGRGYFREHQTRVYSRKYRVSLAALRVCTLACDAFYRCWSLRLRDKASISPPVFVEFG